MATQTIFGATPTEPLTHDEIRAIYHKLRRADSATNRAIYFMLRTADFSLPTVDGIYKGLCKTQEELIELEADAFNTAYPVTGRV